MDGGCAQWGSTPPARADVGFDDLLDLLDPGWAAGAVDPTVPDAAADSESFDLSALSNEFVYQPIHTVEQDWITSSFGEQLDTVLNTTWHEVGGTGILPDRQRRLTQRLDLPPSEQVVGTGCE